MKIQKIFLIENFWSVFEEFRESLIIDDCDQFDFVRPSNRGQKYVKAKPDR